MPVRNSVTFFCREFPPVLFLLAEECEDGGLIHLFCASSVYLVYFSTFLLFSRLPFFFSSLYCRDLMPRLEGEACEELAKSVRIESLHP